MKSVILLVPFDTNQSMGGAVLVDARIYEHLTKNYLVSKIAIQEISPTLKFRVRSNFTDLVRITIRMLIQNECYSVSKFRYQKKAYDKLLIDIKNRIQPNCQIVTSGWISALVAHDAGLKISQHFAHNVEFEVSRSFGNILLKLNRDWKKLKKFELSLYKSATQLNVLSEIDKEKFEANGMVDVKVFRVIRPKIFSSRPKIIQPVRIGFIGSLSWPPNQQAFNNLETVILPLLQLANIKFEVYVAGIGTDKLKSKFILHKLGVINDIEAFYESIDLIIISRNALQTTGISIKALEALEHSKVVIGDIKTMGPFQNLPNAFSFDLVSDIPNLLIKLLARG